MFTSKIFHFGSLFPVPTVLTGFNKPLTPVKPTESAKLTYSI